MQYFDVSHRTRSTHYKKRVMGRAGILLHSTEGKQSLEWLQGNNPAQEKIASADFLIDRAGNCFQIAPRGSYTYHVGAAMWHNLSNLKDTLNQLLIGIEHESHESDLPRYTDEQLVVSAALCRKLMQQHLIGVFNIDFHGVIAVPPGRRSDPVNWPAYIWTKELISPSKLSDSFVWPAVLP